MSERIQEFRVTEGDLDTDCLVFENTETGVTAIFVNPNQSFDYAVKAVQRVCPDLSLKRIQHLVRTHCPNIVEMNERLGVEQQLPRFEAAPDAGVVAPAPQQPPPGHRRPKPPRWARIAAVAAPALVGGFVIAHMFGPSGKALPTPEASPALSQDDKLAASTYKDPAFKKIAEDGAIKCDPMGTYEAKCVDQDGKVMSSEASVGTSTAFTFSYDFEKVGFRLFPDIDSATAWSAEEANKELYQNVRQHGRVVLWGTDAKRIREWEQPFIEEERKRQADGVQGATMSSLLPPVQRSSTPLPSRLATLAFGTLGVTEASVERAVGSHDAESAQLLQAVNLVMGNADLSQLGVVPSGSGDAVAVVLDATNEPGSMTGSNGNLVMANGVTVSAVAPAPPAFRVPASAESQPVAPTFPPVPAPVPAPAPAPAETAPPVQPKPPTAPAPEPEAPKAEVPKQDEGTPPTPVVVPPPAPEPAPTEPAPVIPPPPAEEVPPPVTEELPETPPAPPQQEEPEGGLGMGELPAAWAA
ncbi:hypothetical protein [Streptomyces microflavus]|uniref:hypothetical protein n=1 Tax=Streptomyces microflavus TaxID=1919 RepID=UPI00365AD054